MRRSSQLCLRRWLSSKAGHHPSFSIRRASSDWSEPYMATPLLIDLAARDSKAVRDFDESLAKPRPARDEDDQTISVRAPLLDLLERKERDSIDSPDLLEVKNGLDTRHVTRYDLLCLAMLGSSRNLYGYGSLRHGLSAVSVRKKMSSLVTYRDTLDLLLEYGVLPSQAYVTTASPFSLVETPVREVHDRILDCNSMEELTDTVRFIGQARSGKEMLHASVDQVAIVLARLLSTPNAILRKKALHLIAALASNLDLGGFAIGPQLCGLGMVLASHCYNLSALKMYLDIAATHKYQSDALYEEAVIAFCQHAETAYSQKTRSSALSLLTGWDVAGDSGTNQQRKASFATILKDSHNYDTYLEALARYKASESLRWEWTIRDAEEGSLPTRSGRQSQHSNISAFVFAFSLAGDPAKALDIVEKEYRVESTNNQIQGMKSELLEGQRRAAARMLTLAVEGGSGTMDAFLSKLRGLIKDALSDGHDENRLIGLVDKVMFR